MLDGSIEVISLEFASFDLNLLIDTEADQDESKLISLNEKTFEGRQIGESNLPSVSRPMKPSAVLFPSSSPTPTILDGWP